MVINTVSRQRCWSCDDWYKMASAYLRNGKVFLRPVSRTTQGSWRASDPVLLASESDKDLGSKVLDVLSRSMQGVPERAPEKEHDDPMLKAAGLRSFNAFSDFAKCVSISMDDDVVVLTPTKNGGPRNRFLFLAKEIKCRALSAEVDTALRNAFDACER
jgi:hypothetical protein